MKTVLFLLMFFSLSYTSYAMKDDSLFCFTKKEVIFLANKFRETEDTISFFKVINVKKDSLIKLQDTLYFKAKTEISLYKKNAVIWKQKEDEYKKIIKNLEPAWYNNKFLWFGLGIVATIIVVK